MTYQQAPFAHLDPMQRIFKLTDPNMSMSFPSGHRLEGHSEQTKALMIDVLQQCLQVDPRRRASIPDLLHHPFLQDSLNVTRCEFDRAMDALVTGFCEAARSTATSESGMRCPEHGDNADLDSPCHSQWQLLADQVWLRMSNGLGGGLRKRRRNSDANDRGDDEMLGFQPYQNVLRHWMACDGNKRQRVDDAADAQTLPGPVRPKVSKPPPPPRGNGPPPSAAARVPLVSGGLSNRNAVANMPKPEGTKAGDESKVVIHADMLQQRIAGLRKVGADQGSKENSCPNSDRGSSDKMSEDNPVLRRLKERRRVVADEPTGEITQTTRWLSTPAEH
jgi:hypothetical protein